MSKPAMNGAQVLMHTLADAGVDVCFSNPGTSEMHFVAALDSEPRMRAVLCLFEGVATGAARGLSGQVATLVLPDDVSWGKGGVPEPARVVAKAPVAGNATIRKLATLLQSGQRVVFLLGATANRAPALMFAGKVAGKTGAKLLVETFPLCMERGAVHTVSTPEQDATASLRKLAEALEAQDIRPPLRQTSRPSQPSGQQLTAERVCKAVGALMPENTIQALWTMARADGTDAFVRALEHARLHPKRSQSPPFTCTGKTS